MKNLLTPAFNADDDLLLTKGSGGTDVVMFVDYTCARTRRVRDVFRRASEKFEHLDLTFAVRFCSTEQHRTAAAEQACRAAIAANRQGQFAAMHMALYEIDPQYTHDSVIELARQLDLDLPQFEADMVSPATDLKLQQDDESSRASFDVPHTPMLFIDGEFYRGVWDDSALLEAIERPLGVRLDLAGHKFFEWAASAGLVLITATLAALLLVNLGWEGYEHLRESLVGAYFGDTFRLEMTLESFINDALMAIFFLIVGIEIKREFLYGELSDRSTAALPVFAAIGGMLVPALVYYAINAGHPTAHGWGVPMATDIAFTLGILALLGRRVPTSLKVMVSALAIADDLGAILVIALFYGHGFHLDAFIIAIAVFAVMIGMNRARIYSRTPYIILGLVLWYFTYRSGLHATLAGVLTAIAIPSRPSAQLAGAAEQANAIIEHEASKSDDIPGTHSVLKLKDIVDRLRDPGFHLQHALEKWSNYFVLPLFAFFNTGILMVGTQFSIAQPEVLGTVMGLVVGKPVGIMLFVYISLKLGIAKLSPEISWLHLLGAGCLAGVGFTMSIFIASEAFSGDQLQSVKLGVLIASLLAASIGIIILLFASRSNHSADSFSNS